MTRGELATLLGAALQSYGVPVVPDPTWAAKPPAVICQPGNPYRTRGTACWEATLELIAVAGRMDELDVYDRCDRLVDTLLEVLGPIAGVRTVGAAMPTPRNVGDVDVLASIITVTVFGTGPGLPEK